MKLVSLVSGFACYINFLTIRIKGDDISGLQYLHTEAVVVEVNSDEEASELVALVALLQHQALQIVPLQ